MMQNTPGNSIVINVIFKFVKYVIECKKSIINNVMNEIKIGTNDNGHKCAELNNIQYYIFDDNIFSLCLLILLLQ